MKKQRSQFYLALILAVLLGSLSVTAGAEADTALFKRQVTAAIIKARTGETAMIRADAAERLADLTPGIDPNKVDDKTLSQLVSLLAAHEDSVRLWAAVTLGNLGLRARIAIPKLRELLPEADCVRGELTSADGIRYALARMRINPPYPTCGRLEANDVMFKRLLTKTIIIVREGQTVTIRTNAAQHLSELTDWIDPNKVGDQAVSDLVSVLNASSEGSVRFWVVGALGNLKTRAEAAIPDLQKILAEENCATESPLSISVEDKIRNSLHRMGAKVPPSPCGRS